MKTSQQTIVIGNHAVDLSREALIDPNGSIVPLRPRAWMVLRFLALRAGRLVGKAELMDEVWADCEVTEDSLVQRLGTFAGHWARLGGRPYAPCRAGDTCSSPTIAGPEPPPKRC
jgi:hypothetical protein